MQKGYIKARQAHPEALHISNAYRLPGTEVDSENYADDGKHGCGRLIMKLLKDWNIDCRAVYVVRYYGGTHLGTKRFDYMMDAVKSCVARSSYNSITKTNQYPWEEIVSTRTYNSRGRGGRGRGKYSPNGFMPSQISPHKSYSDALTPSKKRNRTDPALADQLVNQETILKQQQMLTRAASAAIGT